MAFLLDTNILSVLRRPERGPMDVVTRIGALGRSRCFVSVITLMEMKIGVLLKARHDPVQASILDQWVMAVQAEYASGRTIDIDREIALRCAALHVPGRRPYPDALIAATALARGLTLVTRNVADFTGTGVAILDPWNA